MDHVQFPYRSSSHLALMHVINESGAWARQDLEVDYDKGINRDDAHKLVPTGEVEFVSGNHVSTYAARARGDTWVYLGQTVSKNNISLVTRPDIGIEKLEDVRHRKFGSRGRHPGLNTWLYLKQHGLDPDTDQVEIVREERVEMPDGTFKLNRKSLMDMVKDGDVDACFMSLPNKEFAHREGLKIIDIEAQPMVFFMTISSSMKLVEERPDIIERMLKGVIEGIAFFKTEREKSIQILMEKHNKEGQLDRAVAEMLYDDIAPVLEPKLFPGLDAISNVYQEALKQDEKNGDAARIHPLALWDFHFLREIDDSGFINNLYKDHPEHLEGHGG
ncbi:MAG: ABC transporter substrate-binding protein [Alphaproteobacteria bacterium]|nr:ABC transporter substrate-binding protein [Alphaproteobacteria bacterium]